MTFACFDENGVCLAIADAECDTPQGGTKQAVQSGSSPNDVWWNGTAVIPVLETALELPRVLDVGTGVHSFSLPANTIAVVNGVVQKETLLIDTAKVTTFLIDVRGCERGSFTVQVADYAARRRKAYPPIEDQLDVIFHRGLEAWQVEIQTIKDKYPKPGTPPPAPNGQ